VFVTEPSDAVKTGMTIQHERRRLALRASLLPQLDLWLFGFFSPAKGRDLEADQGGICFGSLGSIKCN